MVWLESCMSPQGCLLGITHRGTGMLCWVPFDRQRLSQAGKLLLGLWVHVTCMSEHSRAWQAGCASEDGTSLGAGACTLLGNCLHVLIRSTCFTSWSLLLVSMQPSLQPLGRVCMQQRSGIDVCTPHQQAQLLRLGGIASEAPAGVVGVAGLRLPGIWRLRFCCSSNICQEWAS